MSDHPKLDLTATIDHLRNIARITDGTPTGYAEAYRGYKLADECERLMVEVNRWVERNTQPCP
jgi:hypothetical protein